MRPRIDKNSLIQYVKRVVRKLRHRYNRLRGPALLRKRLAKSLRWCIVIGSASKYDVDWIPTERQYLDLLKLDDWSRYFTPGSIDAMLAEHVWEHLTTDDGLTAAKTCFTYLRSGGYLRVAVPDGFHPDPNYLEWVRVGGASPMQITNDHRVLYTYRTLTDLFERASFKVKLYEYFDEGGQFHQEAWDPAAGTIRRSMRFDRRNKGGTLRYTSIILDALKP